MVSTSAQESWSTTLTATMQASGSIGTPAATARTSFIIQPSSSSVVSAQSTTQTLPPEVEQTLAALSGHRSVLGFMFLSRGHPISIIRHSGVIFEGEQGKKYASAISRIIDSVQVGLEDVSGGDAGSAVRWAR
jgi:dynein light chain roadblock-type